MRFAILQQPLAAGGGNALSTVTAHCAVNRCVRIGRARTDARRVARWPRGRRLPGPREGRSATQMWLFAVIAGFGQPLLLQTILVALWGCQ